MDGLTLSWYPPEENLDLPVALDDVEQGQNRFPKVPVAYPRLAASNPLPLCQKRKRNVTIAVGMFERPGVGRVFR
jgi:hypothetical protein